MEHPQTLAISVNDAIFPVIWCVTLLNFLFCLDYKNNRKVPRILLRTLGRISRDLFLVLCLFLFLFHLSYQSKRKLLEIKRV